jgi:uncharacterized protein YfaS (alpha-2-macroglobulin family)
MNLRALLNKTTRSAVVLSLASTFFLSPGCRQQPDSSRGVELIQSSTPPTPGMTFELRFEQPMVKAPQVGVPAAESPLVFSPPLPGTFMWLSARSGTFTPAGALPLDTRYELSLRPRLRQADGQPAPVFLRYLLQTPPLRLLAWLPEKPNTNATSEPEVKLVFNADVRAGDAAPFLVFRDQAGASIPADVRQGTIEESPQREFERTVALNTWKRLYEESHPAKKPRHLGASDEGEAPTNEVPNLLIATPRTHLPAGQNWKLVLEAGLSGAEPRLRLRQRHEVPVGNVTPFRFFEATAGNVLNQEPSLCLSFSKPIPGSLTNEFERWIEVTPRPTNLTAVVGESELILRGNFKSRKDYTVKLLAGLPSSEAFTLESENSLSVYMPPVPSRLYFAAFSEDQLAAGNRSFPLLAVNVPRVMLRAKLMDPNTAIHALRGYRSYFAWSDRDSWEEPYRSVDYNAVPGRTVFKMGMAGSAELDVPSRLELSWDTILGGRRNGVVFLDARRDTENESEEESPGTQALIQLTDLGMVWKQSREGVEVFVFSHRTAQPVSGAAVRLVSDENDLLAEAATDTNGLAHLRGDTNAQWVVAQHEDDFHAMELHRNNLGLWSYHVPFVDQSDSNSAGDWRRVMLFSDRDLYRPGETLHLKVLARDWTDHGLVVPMAKAQAQEAAATNAGGTSAQPTSTGGTPAPLKGELEIVDARENQFFHTNVVFSGLGAWSADVPVPASPRGWYTAKLRVEDQEFTHVFQVQDFQPAAFELSLKAKAEFFASERVELPLSARYYFGKPLSKAQVKWSLEAGDCGFHPERFNSFCFERNDYEFRFGRGSSSLALSGAGMLSASSNFVIAPDLPVNPEAPQPRLVSVLAEVTDLNQQTLSQSASFVRHASEFYLGLRQGANVLTAGKALPLEAVAVGADGKPWPAPVKAHLKLQRVKWESTRVQGAGRAVRYHTEAVFTNLVEREIEVQPVPLPAQPTDEAKGQPLAGFETLDAGQYLLELSSRDSAGRAVISSLTFKVAAPADLSWDYRNDTQLALRTAQTTYAPGQTAEILVEAPFSGFALVTVEREKVLRSFLTKLAGNAPFIRVPLEAGDAPNVFVGVTLVRGSDDCTRKVKEPEFRSGYCQLAVVDPQSRLTVGVSVGALGGVVGSAGETPAPLLAGGRTNFLPGETIETTVEIKDAGGLPVPGAEVTLYAVDEGILSLINYAVPNPQEFFYTPRSLAVQSGVSLPNLLSEDPEQLRFENKGYLGGGGGLERLRKNFLACAFWNATLLTDAAGKLTASFTAPDSLTRYRMFAVAHTANSRFGSGQTTFQISKPLQVEPALPRFANLTDHLLARAVIQNQTAKAGEVVVSLQLDDKARPEDAGGTPSRSKPRVSRPRPASRTIAHGEPPRLLTATVNVPANGSAIVEFPLEMIEPGTAQWIWRARFADPSDCDFTDAVQSTLEVNHLAPLLREVLLARVTVAQTNLLSRANPQLVAGTGVVTVVVANTRLSELAEAAADLLHYPYGCAEQTGSSMIPWLVLRDCPELLALIHRGAVNTAGPIRAGIDRFLSMQTESGGLGYWPGAKEPMLWASAYGGLILAMAQRQGFETPAHDYDRLMGYLSGQLRDAGDDSELSDQCLALYALAMADRSEPAYHERLFEVREKLTTEDRALLAIAIAESHGPGAMIGELLKVRPSAPHRDYYRFVCPSREGAIRLLAWTHCQPGNPVIDSLVDDLMHAQKRGHWDTTQGDAWAMLALSEYAHKIEGVLPPIAGHLWWLDQSFPFALNEKTNVFTQQFPIADASGTPLLLVNDSTNRLFATTSLDIRPPVAQQPRQDLGFYLERRYERLDDDNLPHDLEDLRVGDRVLVTLRFGVREPARYVAIDDALPSVFEAVNPEFINQQTRPPNQSVGLSGDYGDYWGANFREIRKDRFLSFVDWLAPGNYTLRYVARVRAAGDVTAPTAKIEEMYHPERCGLSGTQPVASQKWE